MKFRIVCDGCSAELNVVSASFTSLGELELKVSACCNVDCYDCSDCDELIDLKSENTIIKAKLKKLREALK